MLKGQPEPRSCSPPPPKIAALSLLPCTPHAAYSCMRQLPHAPCPPSTSCKSPITPTNDGAKCPPGVQVLPLLRGVLDTYSLWMGEGAGRSGAGRGLERGAGPGLGIAVQGCQVAGPAGPLCSTLVGS